MCRPDQLKCKNMDSLNIQTQLAKVTELRMSLEHEEKQLLEYMRLARQNLADNDSLSRSEQIERIIEI